ncbi:MAG: hypothetical protein Q9210_006677, partial [Variospora velana]
MRRTLVGRKARKKRIAENAEMNGENFYARQNTAAVAPAGARAETPPPLKSQPPMVNGGLGADKLPSFTSYEKNPHDFEDDRVPLNTRTPSNRTLPGNGMQPQSPDEPFDTYAGAGRGFPPRGGPRGMGGGRGGYGGPRDEYGNPLPPSNAFGPTPGPVRRDPSDPGMRHQYSDDGMGGARGRGRGGFPARGYGRGGPYGPGRGGPNQYGRGAPMSMAAGAGEMRKRGGPGPPPGYGNGYTPMAEERPGQYDRAAAAGYGRSPSAPAYGRRSPGPPSAPGYARQPSPGPPSNPAGYGRRPSPGPPSHPGGYGRQPSPGGRSVPLGGYGRQSPGLPSASGPFARQRSNSNPGGYDHHGRQPSPGAYQGQGMRAESPPPPMPIPANEGAIGQAVEMDATTGSPSRTPVPYQPMQLRDSDSDVQGLVGLQRRREHRESPMSLTSVYSSQEPYVPPRTAWANPASRSDTTNPSNPSHKVASPIADLPITELPANTPGSPPIPQLISTAPNSNTATQIPGHNRYNSADTYVEDVDPRFAEPTEPHLPQTQSSAPLPSALTAGLHPQHSQQGIMEKAKDSHHSNAYLQPSHSYDSFPDNTHDAGSRSPAISDGSNYTSISQRGINPAWQPPANHAMGAGGVPNRKPMGQQREVLLASNPDFELPIQGSRPGTAGGRPRDASRGQRQPGMIPGMEAGHAVPLTPQAAVLPPLIYYFALILLPPFPNQVNTHVISFLRSFLAIIAGILFFRLPIAYHVPFSVGLTYQLALVGIYGGCRCLDAFFISPYLFHHIPRRVKYHHEPRPDETAGRWRSRALSNSYFNLHFLQPREAAITETAITDKGYPESWRDRASWALELELSMRGAGFTWTSTDVRHTKKTWTPSVGDRLHSILLHVLPALGISFAVIRHLYSHHLQQPSPQLKQEKSNPFDALPFPLQLTLTAALGAFLMTAFSLGHSAFAIALAPLKPHPLSYFPPLYTTRVHALTSVRAF